jgi:hypothetical protein
MRMRTKKLVRWSIVGGVLLSLVPLAAWVSAQTSMIPRASGTWSRGQVIGRTPVRRRAALQVAPDGGVFLIWRNLEERLELARIGEDGEVLLNRVLSVGADEARDPQLEVGADGRLSLLWHEGEHPHSTVRYVLLEADGTPVDQPQVLSDPASPILDPPRLVCDADDRCHAMWADEAGIQWAVLSAGGTLLKTSTLLAAEGRFPAVRVDNQGRLHLTWGWQKRANVWIIHHVALDPVTGALGQPEELAQVFLRHGQRLGELTIGLTLETGYVLWGIQDYAVASSSSEYAHFHLEFSQQRQVEPLDLRRGRNPAGVYTLIGPQTPLLLALSESVPDSAGGARSQIAVIGLGQRVQEDVVTASSQASLKPTLAVDSHSRLHLAWLESAGFRQYRVVYASTAPQVIENYNALTLLDVVNAMFSSVFQLSTLVVTLVVTLMKWVSIPFLGLLLYHLVTSEETLDTVRSRVAVVTALMVQVALTFVLPPSIGKDVLWSSLRWTVPAVSAVATALLTVSFVRRRKGTHLFGVFFLFTALNSVLQMAVFLLL